MRWLVLACLVPALARAEPEPVTTWVSNDEAFGGRGPWFYWGAGLALRHEVIDSLEVGVEGQALRIDAQADADPRHGFAIRGAITLDVPLAHAAWGAIDWRLSPQLGAGSELHTGLGSDRASTELFAGVRASFRKVLHREPRAGAARAIGGHLTVRIARTDGELGGAFLLGYDWGM